MWWRGTVRSFSIGQGPFSRNLTRRCFQKGVLRWQWCPKLFPLSLDRAPWQFSAFSRLLWSILRCRSFLSSILSLQDAIEGHCLMLFAVLVPLALFTPFGDCCCSFRSSVEAVVQNRWLIMAGLLSFRPSLPLFRSNIQSFLKTCIR